MQTADNVGFLLVIDNRLNVPSPITDYPLPASALLRKFKNCDVGYKARRGDSQDASSKYS